MPASSSLCAMTSLSSTEKETDSPCVPSRRVVSNVKIFMRQPLPPVLFGRHAGFLLLLEERHHRAQFLSHHYDGLVAGSFPHGQKVLAPGLVLFDPLPRELAGLDLGKDLPHFGARLLIDYARPACVVAVLGGVRNREAHVGEAAFLDEV